MTELPSLKEVMRRHGLEPKKSLGQNFILDGNLTDKIARAGGSLEGKTVVEVGPGPGGLTRSILRAGAAQLFAIEKDSRCLEALNELAAIDHRLTVIEGDATEFDWAQLPAPFTVVANLPYNVATPLLINWLKHQAKSLVTIDALVLMFQKEVGDRIVASPASKAYGRLAVICQWLCQTKRCFDVPPSAFVPPPKVVSSVVKLSPRKSPLFDCDFASLEKVTAAAFGQRRKMLRQSLRAHFGAETSAVLAACGIEETKRAEVLSLEDFGRLAIASG